MSRVGEPLQQTHRPTLAVDRQADAYQKGGSASGAPPSPSPPQQPGSISSLSRPSPHGDAGQFNEPSVFSETRTPAKKILATSGVWGISAGRCHWDFFSGQALWYRARNMIHLTSFHIIQQDRAKDEKTINPSQKKNAISEVGGHQLRTCRWDVFSDASHSATITGTR